MPGIGFIGMGVLEMKEKQSEIISSFLAEAGKKSTSKGYFGSVEQAGLACWIVAEQVDAYEAKDSAKIAVDHIIGNFTKQPTISRAKIKEYLGAAHQKLKAESSYEMLKVGLVMVVTDYSKIVWAVVGNVRLYHFRDDKFSFRSKDQTIAQVMVDSGVLDEDEVNERQERNNLINHLGGITEFKPFVSEPFRLQNGDVLLLCNSGLWEKMKNTEIADLLDQVRNPQEFLAKLKAAVLSKGNPGMKSYTMGAIFTQKVMVENNRIDYRKIISPNLKLSSKMITKLFAKITAKKISPDQTVIKKISVLSLLVLLIVSWGWLANQRVVAMRARKEFAVKKQIEISRQRTLADHEQSGDQLASGEQYQAAIREYQLALQVAKILNNHSKITSVVQKVKATRLILAGDHFIANGNYEAALNEYAKVSHDAAGSACLQNGLTKKIGWTRQMIELLNLYQAGDQEANRQNYTVARFKYQSAQNIASQISNVDLKSVLAVKLSYIDQKIAQTVAAKATAGIEARSRTDNLAEQTKQAELGRKELETMTSKNKKKGVRR
jgi:serine/threonine protein phosphatase PrpC